MAGSPDLGPGVAQAWEKLAAADPTVICRRAMASYDPGSASYGLTALGARMWFTPSDRRIAGEGAEAGLFLGRLSYFFHHSTLWYLVQAGDFSETGRLVGPGGLKGGSTFFTGTHALPLSQLAEAYNGMPDRFTERGVALGGQKAGYGDRSVLLRPLPKVPVLIILRLGDDEFPPRADLLFDSSVELHLPLDVIWSIAMLSVLAMMPKAA